MLVLFKFPAGITSRWMTVEMQKRCWNVLMRLYIKPTVYLFKKSKPWRTNSCRSKHCCTSSSSAHIVFPSGVRIFVFLWLGNFPQQDRTAVFADEVPYPASEYPIWAGRDTGFLMLVPNDEFSATAPLAFFDWQFHAAYPLSTQEYQHQEEKGITKTTNFRGSLQSKCCAG